MPDVTLGPPSSNEVNQTAVTITGVHGRYDPPAYIPMPGPARRVSNASRQKVREITVNATNSIMPAVYGRARVGASIFFFDTFGGSMYIGAAISWGEIEEIESVTINNVDATSYTSVLMEQFTGTPSQGVSTIIQDARALLGDTTYDEIKPGIAYVALKIGQAAAPAVSGIPEIKITLKGRKIYDPRTGLTEYSANPYLAIRDLMTNDIFGGRIPTAKMNDAVGGSIQTSADYADVNVGIASPTAPPGAAPGGAGPLNGTFYWKITFVDGVDNETIPCSGDSGPLAITNQEADLSSIEIGPLGTAKRRVYRSDDNVTYVRVGEIHNNTDTTFTDSGAGSAIFPPTVQYTKPRFQIGIAMMAEGNLVDWVDTLRAHAPCWITFNGKQYDIIADMPDVNGVIQAFTPDNILKGSFKVAKTGMKDSPTSVQVKFTDQLHDFIDGSAIQELASIATGADYSRPAVYDLPGVTDSDHANRLCVYYLNARLADLTIGFDTPLSVGVKVLPGDLVSITFPVGFSGALFRVMDVEESEDGNIVHVTALEYSTAKYLDYVLQTDPGTQGGAGDPFGTPADPTSVVASQVTDLGDDGLFHVRIFVDWVNGATDYYKTTRAKYTYDGGATFVQLGDFKNGPITVENPQIGVEHTFYLYTVSATDQLSTGATVSITPYITSASVPEVTQFKFLGNLLEFYAPIPPNPEILIGDPPPAPTVGGSGGFGSGVTPGDHLVASSRVFKWGEGQMGSSSPITIPGSGGPWKIDVSDIDPAPPAQTLFKKLYYTKDAGSTWYHVSEEGIVGETDQIIIPDGDIVDNAAAPELYKGISKIQVFDAFGIADPTTDPMPLFHEYAWPTQPHRYHRLDCTPIVHKDGTAFVIKVYVRVVTSDNRISDGAYWETLTAHAGNDDSGVTNAVINQNDDTQIQSGFLVSQIGGVGIPAVGLWSLYQSDGTSFPLADGQNDNCRLKIIAGLYNAGGSGSGAPFSISGFKLETDAGVGPPLFHVEIEIVNVDETGAIMSINHATGSDSLCQVHCPEGVDYVVGGLWSTVTLRYNALVGSWFVMQPIAGLVPDGLLFNSVTDEDKWLSIMNTAKAKLFAVGPTDTFTLDGGATYDDVTIPATAVFIVNGTAGTVTITGFVNPNGGYNHGSIVTLEDDGTGRTFVFKHDDAGSAAGGRFWCPGLVDLTMTVASGSVTWRWDYTSGYWKLYAKNF